MKKILIFLITIISLLLPLGFVSYADDSESISISDDYKTLEYQGQKYYQVDFPYYNANINSLYASDAEFDLTEEQESAVESITCYTSSDILIRLSIQFISGGNIYEYYVREDTLGAYNQVMQQKGKIYRFYKFGYNEGNVYMTRDMLYGESVLISPSEFFLYSGSVISNTFSEETPFSYEVGKLFVGSEGNCYYLDFSEHNSTSVDFSPLNYDKLTVHRVTDEELCSILRGDAVEKEKNRDFIDSTVIIIVILMLVCPAAFALFFALCLKKADKTYRILYLIAISVCVLTLICFIALALTVAPFL